MGGGRLPEVVAHGGLTVLALLTRLQHYSTSGN